MMRKVSIFALIAVLAFSTAMSAQSSKATAAINTAVSCSLTGTSNIGDTVPISCKDIFTGADVPVGNDNFVPIMTTSVKLSNSQSLFVSPSLVTGLYTKTKTKTATNSSSTAVAMGGVYLRAVLKDASGTIVAYGYPAAACTDDILGCYKNTAGDYGVVLDTRVQTLTQSISDCVVNVTVGGVAGTGTCSFDSTIDLILQTTSAHTFNFIFPNVGVGTYELSIEAALSSNATVGGSGTAIGAAAFGLGSVTAESVRLVHGFSF